MLPTSSEGKHKMKLSLRPGRAVMPGACDCTSKFKTQRLRAPPF